MTNMKNSIKIKIGPVVANITSQNKDMIALISKNYPGFKSTEKAELVVDVKLISKNTLKPKQIRIFYNQKKDAVSFISGSWGIKASLFLKDKRMLLNLRKVKSPARQKRMFLIAFRLLFEYHIIAIKKGILLHASGLIKKHDAYVFSGNCGSGKSFIAKNLKDKKGFKLMNDECILLTYTDKKTYAYSTIFTGKEALRPNNLHGKIKALYFLKKSNQNRRVRLSQIQSATNFLYQTILPGIALKNTTSFQNNLFRRRYLELVSRMSSNTRCYELERNFSKKRITIIE